MTAGTTGGRTPERTPGADARTVRVCHVITRLDLGGAQDNTLHTVRTLRAPYRASLVAGPGGLLDDEAGRIEGVRVTFVPSLKGPIRPWDDLRALRDLERLFRSERPHVVHTHSSKAGVVGRLAAARAGVPVVVHTIHGFGFNAEQPPWLRTALVAAERLAARRATHVVAVSRAHLERGAALGCLDPARASVIRSGVHLGAFRAAADEAPIPGGSPLRRDLGLPADAPVVGLIACLKPQKAPLDFVEAAARVVAMRPDARFLVAGDGELRGAVEARCKALGIADKVRLLGWRRDVPRIMAAVDIVVLTSLWEGLPRVVPEAIAAGRPVVATAVDGTAEILRDGHNALTARAGDPQGIARGVLRILGEPALGPALVRAARPLLAEFDIDDMVRAQERLYAALLERLPGTMKEKDAA